MRGVALLIDTIDKITDRLNPRLKVDGILATMYDCAHPAQPGGRALASSTTSATRSSTP